MCGALFPSGGRRLPLTRGRPTAFQTPGLTSPPGQSDRGAPGGCCLKIGGVTMTNVERRVFSRRRLVKGGGALVGAGVSGSLIERAWAAPARTEAAIAGRFQDTTKLTLWGQFPELLEPFKAMLADFTAANPGVEIDVQMTPTDQYKAKVQTALNTGSGPDLFGANSRPQLDIDVTSGLIRDLTGLVDLGRVTQTGKDAVTINEQIWAVPSGRYTVGICYHVDLFEKAGVTAEPTTWAETHTVFQQLLDAGITPYSTAVKDGSLSYFNYIGLASSILGQEGFDAVLAGEKPLNDEDGVKVVEELRNWIPYYQRNYLGTVYAESKALFASKQTAAMDCGSADLSGYYEIDPNAQLGFFAWPAYDETRKQVTNTGLSVLYSINAASEKIDAAVTFLNWVATPEGATSMNQHIKLLPLVEGVEPQGDPILTEMVQSPLDLPVWYERWPTLGIGDLLVKEGNAAFDVNTPAQEFADKIQATVEAQLASPMG